MKKGCELPNMKLTPLLHRTEKVSMGSICFHIQVKKFYSFHKYLAPAQICGDVNVTVGWTHWISPLFWCDAMMFVDCVLLFKVWDRCATAVLLFVLNKIQFWQPVETASSDFRKRKWGKRLLTLWETLQIHQYIPSVFFQAVLEHHFIWCCVWKRDWNKM